MNQSGIYKITCLPTGKFYVGSAKNIQRRWFVHRSDLDAGTHHNQYLQNAWNKYGRESFEFIVLEKVDGVKLFDVEQSWINKTSACEKGFNLLEKASGGSNGKLYVVENPKGNQIQVSNLAKFCEEQGLRIASMYSVASGNLNHYKEYRVWPASLTKSEWQSTLKRKSVSGPGPERKYLITFPDGRTEVTNSLNKFCFIYGLSARGMGNIYRGRGRTYKGFKVSPYND